MERMGRSVVCGIVLASLWGTAACTGDPTPGNEDLPDGEALGAEAPDGLAITMASVGKRLCSSLRVSGRTLDHVLSEELGGGALAGIELDIGDDLVTLTSQGRTQEVLYRPRVGCTLIQDRSASDLLGELDPNRLSVPAPPNASPWPLGDRVEIPDTAPGIDLAAVNRAVDRAFEDIEPDQDIRTRAVLVVHRGRIIAERYSPPFDADTPQLGWSMAKTVTGALTGIMAGDGLLDVHSPAPVPEWTDPDDARAAVTVHHLLQMSSGLAFSEVYSGASMSDVILMLFTTGDAGGFAASQPLDHPPGTSWSYSSGTTNILSRILRDRFDDVHDYVNYAFGRLFNPLGMTSAVMELDEAGAFVGSSFMYATPRDWARFALLYLQDGTWDGERILPEGWVEYSLTPASAAPGGNYGAQIWLNAGEPDDPERRPQPGLPTTMYYLSGFEGQNVVVMPEQELIVLRMGLTTSGPRPIWALSEAVLEALD